LSENDLLLWLNHKLTGSGHLKITLYKITNGINTKHSVSVTIILAIKEAGDLSNAGGVKRAK
jgi:hypothetical protein